MPLGGHYRDVCALTELTMMAAESVQFSMCNCSCAPRVLHLKAEVAGPENGTEVNSNKQGESGKAFFSHYQPL